MLSGMNPKRRWLLAIVAIVVVVGVVGFVVFRGDPKEDLPRLVVLRQEQVYGQKVVVFRFDAPRHRVAELVTMSTVDPSTGEERKPMLMQGVGDNRREIHEVQTPQGKQFSVRRPLGAGAGQSTEFSVFPPLDDVWRLQCGVAIEATGAKLRLERLKSCWREKSFAPLHWTTFFTSAGTIESEPITNAVPRAADAPRP